MTTDELNARFEMLDQLLSMLSGIVMRQHNTMSRLIAVVDQQRGEIDQMRREWNAVRGNWPPTV